MEFTQVVKKRRMCRGYEHRPVERAKLDSIFDVAFKFPSAGHTQPQEFIVVEDQAVKDALAEAALDQMFIAEAPTVVVVVADTKRSKPRYGKRGVEFYSVIDGSFAAMLVLLAAVDQGLGAAFVAAMDDEEVARALHLPNHVRPIGIIPIGYCSEGPRKLKRRPRKEVIHVDRWGNQEPVPES